MKSALQLLVEQIREQQKALTDEERRYLWSEIKEGYCERCGSEHLPCYCEFDE